MITWQPTSCVERERLRGNRLAATWMLRRRACGALPPAQPQPAPPELLGTDGWQRFRAADLARRRPGAGFPALLPAPFPLRSEAGRAWGASVRTTLHLRLEDELLVDPRAFAQLEAEPGALDALVRRALPEVCLEAGMVELPLDDLAALCAARGDGERYGLVASVVLLVRGRLRSDDRWWEAVDAAAGAR
jgi:hypothetical protein